MSEAQVTMRTDDQATLLAPCMFLLGVLAMLWSGEGVAPRAMTDLAAEELPTCPRPSLQERLLIDLTNQERAKEELPPLKPDPALMRSARAHASNMARLKKMEHVLDNKSPADRAREAAYPFAILGENVAYGRLRLDEAIEMWMRSESHARNILNPQFSDIGVGISRCEDGNLYFAQVFGKRRSR
jgi:uncharacterized protein YkwD